MSGTTDRVGREFGVSLRELAQDLGISSPWRRWTVEGWAEEMAKLAGDPDVRPAALNPVDEANLVGTYSTIMRRRNTSAVVLIRSHRPKPRLRTYPDRTPVVSLVAQGRYFPSVMVLLHELLSSRGVDCPEMAALATRFLAEGQVTTVRLA